jgi:hypothetical protein
MRVQTRSDRWTKVKFWLIATLLRRPVPDVLHTLHHRPELFGRPFGELTEAVLRGPSEWSVGERELFAAFVSNLNRCRF